MPNYDIRTENFSFYAIIWHTIIIPLK